MDSLDTPEPSPESQKESWQISRASSFNSSDSEGARIHRDVLKLYARAAASSYDYWYQENGFHFKEQYTATASRECPVEASVPEATMPSPLGQAEKAQVQPSEPDAVDWDGESDRANPLNWPKWKKLLNIIVILMMCVTHAFAITAFIPALPDITDAFDQTNRYLSDFAVSAYVLGFTVGPLIIVPLSEIFGRVPMYHVCNLIFIGATCWCAVTESLVTLVVARLVAGLGGGVTQVLAAGSVEDMTLQSPALLMTVLGTALYLTPGISPLAGSHINARFGYKWIFWINAIMGGACTVAGLPFLFETYEPVLLWRKAYKLRKSTHSLSLEPEQTVRHRCLRAVRLPLRMLLSPSVFVVSIVPAAGFAFLYMVYITLPETFLSLYHWQSKNHGLAYLGVAAGIVIVLIGGGPASDSYVGMRTSRNDIRPENRLVPLLCFWPLAGLGLFLYGYTLRHKTHWAYPMASTGLVGAGVMSAILFNGLYIIDAFPARATSGILASVLLQSLIGGAVPLFSNKLVDFLSIPNAFYLLGAIALGLTPLPWILYMLRKFERKTQ